MDSALTFHVKKSRKSHIVTKTFTLKEILEGKIIHNCIPRTNVLGGGGGGGDTMV